MDDIKLKRRIRHFVREKAKECYAEGSDWNSAMAIARTDLNDLAELAISTIEPPIEDEAELDTPQ